MISERKLKQHFSGKRVIITGSSRGIGRRTASLLGSYGARIVLNGRNTERLVTAVDALSSEGADVIGIACDISDPLKCREFIEEGAAKLGGIDILINNAGLSMRGKMETLNPDVYRSIFSANLFGAVNATIYTLPYLKQSRGSLLYISSVAGIRGLPGLSAYCSAKMALRAVAESLRFELKGTGVHTGLVYVGYTRNDEGKVYIAADGTMQAIADRSGMKAMSQDRVAKEIVKNIIKRKYISVVTGRERLNYYLQRVSPRFVEFAIGRAASRVENMSK